MENANKLLLYMYNALGYQNVINESLLNEYVPTSLKKEHVKKLKYLLYIFRNINDLPIEFKLNKVLILIKQQNLQEACLRWLNRVFKTLGT